MLKRKNVFSLKHRLRLRGKPFKFFKKKFFKCDFYEKKLQVFTHFSACYYGLLSFVETKTDPKRAEI